MKVLQKMYFSFKEKSMTMWERENEAESCALMSVPLPLPFSAMGCTYLKGQTDCGSLCFC